MQEYGDDREEIEEAMVHPAPTEPSGPGGQSATHELTDQEARNWSVLTHLSGLLWIVSIPGIIGALVFWLLKRDQHPMVDRHGKEAVNFQISLFIYGIIALALVLTIIGILVALPLILVVAVMALVLPIVAAVKASDGKDYRYPFTFRLIN